MKQFAGIYRLAICVAVIAAICVAWLAYKDRAASKASSPPTETQFHGELLAKLSNAERHLREKRVVQAWNEYDQILSDHPILTNALYGRGLAARALGRNAEAIDDLEKVRAIDRAQFDPILGVALAEMYMERADDAAAADEMEHVMAHWAQDPEVKLTRIQWLVRQQLWVDAVESANRLIEENGDGVHVLFFRARSLFELQRLEEAAEDVKRAIELDASDAECHCLLGHIHEAGQNHSEALREFEIAAALRPEDNGLLLRVAWSKAHNNDFDGARELFERLVLDPALETEAKQGIEFVRKR